MRADYADDRAKNGKVLRDPNEDHQSIAGGADEEASIDTSPDSTIPAAFPLLFALTICGAALALCTAVFVMTGSAGRMAATAGFAVGLFAALSAGLRGALIASIGFTCAAGLILAIPVLPVLLAICIALSVLPAVEVALAGTRMVVMVMIGVILFAIATDRGEDRRLPALVSIGHGGSFLAADDLRVM